eukprot:scaffold238916_cov18-Tisochrysis_lutea.AAC.2
MAASPLPPAEPSAAGLRRVSLRPSFLYRCFNLSWWTTFSSILWYSIHFLHASTVGLLTPLVCCTPLVCRHKARKTWVRFLSRVAFVAADPFQGQVCTASGKAGKERKGMYTAVLCLHVATGQANQGEGPFQRSLSRGDRPPSGPGLGRSISRSRNPSKRFQPVKAPTKSECGNAQD